MVNQKIVNQVYATEDYELFKLIRENREIKENIKLRQEIAENGILVPVIVNEDYEVIDGQHRIMIGGALGKEIPFIIVEGAGKKEIISINTTAKQWTLEDYIQSYADEGKENYVRLNDLIDKYDVLTGTLCALAFNTTDTNKSINKAKEGKLEFANYDFLVSYLEFYQRLTEESALENTSSLSQSLYVLYRLEKFDEERIFDKSGAIANELRGITKRGVMMKVILDIYNKNLKNREGQITYFPNAKDTVEFYEKAKKEIANKPGTSRSIYKLSEEDN